MTTVEMIFLQALFLGLIQGITEFFPISSSGHLILVPKILGWAEHSLAFDAVLHLGTGLAILVYFWRDWVEMVSALLYDLRTTRFEIRKFSGTSRKLLLIAMATLPAAIAGVFLSGFVEARLRSPQVVVAALFIVAILMFFSEKCVVKELSKPDLKTSFIIGVSQVLALIPGVSRSGMTIATGLFCGLKREEAARFSFLLAAPLALAAGLWGLFFSSFPVTSYHLLITGFLFSFISGLLAIKILLSLLSRWGLWPFAVYRILLALGLLFFL